MAKGCWSDHFTVQAVYASHQEEICDFICTSKVVSVANDFSKSVSMEGLPRKIIFILVFITLSMQPNY